MFQAPKGARVRQEPQFSSRQRGRRQSTAPQQIGLRQHSMRRSVSHDLPISEQDHPIRIADRQIKIVRYKYLRRETTNRRMPSMNWVYDR